MAYYPTGNPDIDRLIEEYAQREVVIIPSRRLVPINHPSEAGFTLVLTGPQAVSFDFYPRLSMLEDFVLGLSGSLASYIYPVALVERGNRIELRLKPSPGEFAPPNVITTLTDRQSIALRTKLQRLYKDLAQ